MKLSQHRLHRLLYGHSRDAVRFQALWIIFDLLIIAFFVAAPFIPRGPIFFTIDYLIAVLLAVDLMIRAWASGDIRMWLRNPLVWADFAVLASFIVPEYAANLGFLRILRAYSLIHGAAFWRVVAKGQWKDTHTQDTVKAGVNLAVFVFMMAGLVHSSFAARVPAINSYLDSLYFTITALSTTGFGDIVLPGHWGKILSILIMIGGVSLFFRLIQVAMRPHKVRYACGTCGLLRHEPDAIHCKACGAPLKIAHDND